MYIYFLISFCFLIYLFFIKKIFFWLRWVSVAACGLSQVAASGGYSSLRCAGSRRAGFSSCGTLPQ